MKVSQGPPVVTVRYKQYGRAIKEVVDILDVDRGIINLPPSLSDYIYEVAPEPVDYEVEVKYPDAASVVRRGTLRLV